MFVICTNVTISSKMNANKENKADSVARHSLAALSKRPIQTRTLNAAMVKEAAGKLDLLLITSLNLQCADDKLPKIQVIPTYTGRG